MKVFFITNGLTHYYNLVLSKLNSEPGIELIAIVPGQRSAFIGDGVYQTKEGVNFRVIELEETRKLGLYTTFRGMADILRQERPDAVIVIENYLRAFLFDRSLVSAMDTINAGLILKAIPFRYLSYHDVLAGIEDSPQPFESLPSFLNELLRRTGLARVVRKSLLDINRRALNRPDAHVNYVEAYDLWESYGVSKEKIFVTRNSPDTDMLFAVRVELEKSVPLLSPNPFRLIHVGRLVEWKRVDMLLRAVARIRGHFPGIELLVVGTGPQETSLKRLTNELGLADVVTFTGGVYDPRILGRYFMDSALYVLAGMGGISINEAMCFGLPVLCSVGDGTEKFLVREGINGCYFRDGDEDDLVSKISSMLEHPELLRQMGLHSTEIIRNEVNIRTVIDGYIRALQHVSPHDSSPTEPLS